MKTNKITFIEPLKENRGFTLIELMIIIVIIGVLAGLAMINYKPMQRKAYDTIALSDARNLVDAIIDATLEDQDIDFNPDPAPGGSVGTLDNSGGVRPAIFNFSDGVAAWISGDTIQGILLDQTNVTAEVYHINGTPDGATLSGRKEFTIVINEATSFTSMP